MSEQFYRAFEDLHRGTRDLIKERLRVYAPFVQPLTAVFSPARALDLGCGRGEWLELLGEFGFVATGVDLDDGMLAACRERGLDVHTADALAALRDLPDDSLALVSSFHLVEHLEFALVQQLIAEALRVLQPGGLLIMETPNPENLVVGSSSFYLDPSHVKPLPPKLLAFAAEFAGFARHKIVRVQEAAHLHEAGAVTLFGVIAGGSADYSVVAQKAGPAPLPCDAAFGAEFGLELHTLAQRYDQQRLTALAQMAARLDALEAQRQAANQINLQRSEGINEGIVYLDRRLTEESAANSQRMADLEQALAALGASAPSPHAWQDNTRTGSQCGALAQVEQCLSYLELSQQHAKVQAELLQARRSLADMEEALAALRGRVEAADARATVAGQQLAEVGAWARTIEQQLLAVHASTSWQLSRPLRMLGRLRHGWSLRPAIKSLLRRIVAWLASTQSTRRLIAPLRRRFPALDARLLRASAALRRSDPDLSGAHAVMPESAEELANPLPLSARHVLADLQRALSTQ